MTYEDFTTYIENNGDMDVTASTVTFTTMRRDADAYVYNDFGVGHFGDFEHKFTFRLTASEAGDLNNRNWGCIHALTDGIGAVTGNDNNTLEVALIQDQDLDDWVYFQLKHKEGGILQDLDTSYVYGAGLSHYMTIKRAGTTATLKIYSDAARTNLLETLSITCNTTTYRYLHVVRSGAWDTDPADHISGYVRDLDLQEEEDPTNWTHELDVRMPAHMADTASLHVWTRANLANDWQDCGDALGVAIKWRSAQSDYQFGLKSRYSGATNSDLSAAVYAASTWYYLRITRVDTALTLYIYSNSARTSLVEQLSVVIQHNDPFAVTYAVQSNNVGDSGDWLSVDIANLDLGSGTEDYTTYAEVDPNGHITVAAALLDVNGMTEGEDAYVYKGEPSVEPTFTDVAVTDKIFWKKISWTSNVTASHRVAYSLNAGMAGSVYSEWHENTAAPEVYISSENLKPDTTYYYQAETLYLGGTYKDSIRSFTTTLVIGIYDSEWIEIDTVVDMIERKQVELYFHDGIYYLFTNSGTGESASIILYTSTNGIRFKYQGEIISSPPAGHDAIKTPVALVVGATFYLWAGIRWDDAGTNRWRLGRWSGNSFSNLSYDGLALDNDENVNLTRNCRILDVWYDTGISRFCTYVGGASTTAGAWTHVYYAESATPDFRGTLDVNPLYDESDWNAGAWPDTFIYPLKGEWIGGKYLAWGTGCGSSSPPYAFDIDLFFVSAKRTVSKTNSYSGDAASAYSTDVLGLTLPSKCGIASDGGDLSTIFTTYNGFDLVLFKMAGFWANAAIPIEKGYMPRFNYSVAPTEAEFKALLDIMIYVWDHDAIVTVNQVSGTPPIYAQWVVTGTAGDTIWVNIHDLTSTTLKLYRNDVYLKDVNPTGTDFLFDATLLAGPNTFTLETALAIPTVTTQTATGIDWDNGTFHATLHGTITDTGGENCDERGFDWGYSSGSYPFSATDSGSYGIGSFQYAASALAAGKIYFRAKAHNAAGWGYGAEMSFSPPTPDTFGDETEHTGEGSLFDTIHGCKATCPGPGYAVSITVRVKGVVAGDKLMKCALYRASDDGLVAYTSERNISLTTSWVWQTFTFASLPVLSVQDYYIVAWSQTGIQNVRLSITSTPTAYKRVSEGVPYDGWPAHSGVSEYTGSASIYCKCYLEELPPDPPTNVSATDGTYSTRVRITWTKSDGATGYQVYRDGTPLGWLGDVASYDDYGAGAPYITPGNAVASDGTFEDLVALYLSGTSFNSGASHTYKVKARNAAGESGYSNTNNGYRGYGTPGYQWYRSDGDYDSGYFSISGATSSSYNDYGAPAPTVDPGTALASNGSYYDYVRLTLTGESAKGAGRYYKCYLTASGCSAKWSGSNRGYREGGTITYQWYRSAGDNDSNYSPIDGATYEPYLDTGASAATINHGSVTASDGDYQDYVLLENTGASAVVGYGRYYKCLVSSSGAGADYSNANRGYRGVGTLTYQWQRSAEDSPASYSNIDGAESWTYQDTDAPANGDGRYYRCYHTATGAISGYTGSDRGYRIPTVTTMIGGSTGWTWGLAVKSESVVPITSDDGLTWIWGLAVGTITIPVGGPAAWTWEEKAF